MTASEIALLAFTITTFMIVTLLARSTRRNYRRAVEASERAARAAEASAEHAAAARRRAHLNRR